ncbi:MAG: efflux RND transporter periplasmic adaptor subunit [Planctomycetes bacterium]|nr:efflux RND transporter periplasmic adaptor subunit [Planctomycetota bacterium]
MNSPSYESRPKRRILLAALSVTCLAAGCSPEAPPASEAIRPVKTMVVAAGEDVRVRSFPGKVEASRRVELAFQVPGLLVKLPVKEGQQVAKGDVIAELRQDEFQARLTSLQGQLDQARANLTALRAGERPEERLRREAQVRSADARLANARAELNRATELLQRRAIARADFDIAETAYRIAIEEQKAAVQLAEMGTIGREEEIQAREAEVRGLEGRVVEASIQLADSVLRAPYNGVIARRFVEQGQNVQAKAPIVRFQDLDEIEIEVDVPEAVMVTDIRSADIVQMVAELSGAPGVQFPVRIREVAQVADPTTQTFNVRVAMESPPGIQALPGMTATVTASYRRANVLGNRILVPVSAVSKQASGEQVTWVIGPDGTATPRAVKLGGITGGEVEIVDGLQPGDRIAVAGVTFLRDGMKVRDLGDALGSG